MSDKRIFCVIPRELSGDLHDALRRHFRDERSIEVVVERRQVERRLCDDRRSGESPASPPESIEERRKIRGVTGRRVGDRRAGLAPLSAGEVPSLPRRARRHVESIAFVQRLEPSDEQAEDADTARLVTRLQAGESEVFSELYMRYFDRIYGYLRVLLRDRDEAEDVTQQVFLAVFEQIGSYERRAQPFRAWLFTIMRNKAFTLLRKNQRWVAADPDEVSRIREENGNDVHDEDLHALDWISDRDLLMFVERLPIAQRQVLLLRYMLDLSDSQVAEVLGRSREDVRALQYRATKFLRARLAAIGRTPKTRERARMLRCPNQAFVLRERRFSLIR